MPGIIKSLVFRKTQKFCKQEIYKNDHIIDNLYELDIASIDLLSVLFSLLSLGFRG